MATNVFLRDVQSDLAGSGNRDARLTRGAASTTSVTNTQAGPATIQLTKTAGGTALDWYTKPLNAVTISGNITFNLRGLESNIAANAGIDVVIERVSVAGTFISAIGTSAISNEFTTSDAVRTISALAPTSTALSAGDRIHIRIRLRDVGTMGAGQTVTVSYDGASAGAAGDSYVIFTETITERSPTFVGTAGDSISAITETNALTADLSITPPALQGELKLTVPMVQTSEFALAHSFSLGGTGRMTSTRTFAIVQATFTLKLARSYTMVEGRLPYQHVTDTVDTTLAVAAAAGSLSLTLANTMGIKPGMVLQLRPPYGERVVVNNTLKNLAVIGLASATRKPYAVGTRVVEANLNAPVLSVFDKRGVLLGVLQDATITSAPKLAINTDGDVGFRVPRNSPDRGLIADDRIVVIGNTVGAPQWAGVITTQDWSSGQGEIKATDLLSEIFSKVPITLFNELPDATLASTVCRMIVDAVNVNLGEDGQMRWHLDATGSRVYRDDVDYDEMAYSALEDVRTRAGVEVCFRVWVSRGFLVPYLVVRDKFTGYVGVTLSDGPDSIRYRDEVLRKGVDVVAYWRFGETTGTVAAEELGYTGSYVGSPTLNAPGALRKDLNPSVTLNGVNQSVSAADAAGLRLNDLSGFTIVAWVKPVSGGTGTTPSIVSKGAGGAGTGWDLYYSTSTLQVSFKRDNVTTSPAGLVLQLDTWNMVAITYDGLMLRGYLDGQFMSSAAVTFATNNDASTLFFGQNSAGSSWFKGSIDEAALFARMLTDDQVMQLFRSGQGSATDPIGNVVSEPRVTRDPGEKINAVTLTGIETQIVNLVPDWARWAVREVTPKVTVALDTSGTEERRIWDKEVSVDWTLSKAKQKELAQLTEDKLRVMYQSFLRGFHDRYGRPFHEGWLYEGPPDEFTSILSREGWRTRLQLAENPTGTPISVVMSSMADSRVNFNRWLVVGYDRRTAIRSVKTITPSMAAGYITTVTFAAGTYRLYRVAGNVYTGTVSVTFGSQTGYTADSSAGTYYNSNLPAVTLRYGGYNFNGLYESDPVAPYDGTYVRTQPYLSATIVKVLLDGVDFAVRQKTEVGSYTIGSRIWYGDATGTRWVKKERLAYVGPIAYSPKTLRRISSGAYAGLYVELGTGITVSSVAANSTYLSPTESNPIINKQYDFELQRIHLWDPKRDGIGELVSRPSVFNGQVTTRPRWSIVPWTENTGSTTLLRGCGAADTVLLIASYLDLDIGETSGRLLQLGEGAAKEIVLATAQDNYELTVVRAQNSTAAIIHEAGEAVAFLEATDFDGFPFPYDWPEGLAEAADYLDRVRKNTTRVEISVTADTPTSLGRYHTVRLSTEGQGSAYEDVLLRMKPVGYWPLADRAGFGTALERLAPDGWWPLNDPTATPAPTTVLSYNGANDGTIVGNPQLGAVDGPLQLPDVAILLDATADYVTVPNNANLQAGTGSFTVGAWIKTATTANRAIVTKGPVGNAAGYSLTIGTGAAGKVRWWVHSGAIFIDSPVAINDDQWHFVVGTLDRLTNRLRLYVDGELVGTLDASGISATNLNATDLLRMGNDASNNYFAGALGHVFVNRTCLSPSQIDTLYRAAWLSTAWLGTSADASGNGFNATASGSLVPGFNGPIAYSAASFGAMAADAGGGQYTVTHNAALSFGSSSFTVAGWWWFPLTTVNPQRSASKGSPVGNAAAGWAVSHAGTGTITPTLYLSDGVNGTNAPAFATARGQWHHLAWVVDRAKGYVYPYTNGVLGTITALGTVGSVASTADLTLLAGQAQAANGVAMAHFGLWPRALSAADVQQLYDASQGSLPQPEEVLARTIGIALDERAGTNELLLEVV